MTVTCYPSVGKRKAWKICDAFAAGCNGAVAPPGWSRLRPGAAFFYGWTEHTVPLIRQCVREGREWYYADNAYYFGRGKFFRVTRGALMEDGRARLVPWPADRAARFDRILGGIADRQFRGPQTPVVIATQSELFYSMRLGQSRRVWTQGQIDMLQAAVDRQIWICDKPAPGTAARGKSHGPEFEASLPLAFGVVSHSSSCLVAAVVAGVPIWSTAHSMATPMRAPHFEDFCAGFVAPKVERRAWLQTLLGQQWTRQEMREGRCWQDLQRQQEVDPVSRVSDPDGHPLQVPLRLPAAEARSA